MKVLFTKGISSLYDGISLNNNGFIENKGKKIYVFRITPLNILTDNPDYLYQIYNAYMTCIRNIDCNYKIIRLNNVHNIKTSLDYYKRRMDSVQNEGLKKAIFNYLLQLEKVMSEQDYVTSKYYVFAEINGRVTDFVENFKPLMEYGFDVSNVCDKIVLEKILRVILNKEEILL